MARKRGRGNGGGGMSMNSDRWGIVKGAGLVVGVFAVLLTLIPLINGSVREARQHALYGVGDEVLTFVSATLAAEDPELTASVPNVGAFVGVAGNGRIVRCAGDTALTTDPDPNDSIDANAYGEATICGDDKYIATSVVLGVLPLVVAASAIGIAVLWGAAKRAGQDANNQIFGIVGTTISTVILLVLMPTIFGFLDSAILSSAGGSTWSAAQIIYRLIPVMMTTALFGVVSYLGYSGGRRVMAA